MKSILAALVLLAALSPAYAQEDPLSDLKVYTVSYFKPLTGSIVHADSKTVVMSVGAKDSVRAGMRFRVLREGAPFIHPVTKEPLGKVETATGRVEVREVSAETSTGTVVDGDAQQGDRVRISETRVRVLFCQDKALDWHIADEYYRRLKAEGRLELVDTALETSDEAKVLEEAKRLGAEVALLLTSQESEKGTVLRERLFWVVDGAKFGDMEAVVSADYAKGLRFGEEYFAQKKGEAVMTYDLPFSARFIVAGDMDGDGRQEYVLSNGSVARVYAPAGDLKFLWEVKEPASADHLWIDSVDLDKNGKDELIITSMRSEEVTTNIYELNGAAFQLMWSGKYFVRRLGSGLIAQAYRHSEGFSGDVVNLVWDGGYKIGDKVKLPKDVAIYDFVFLDDGSGKNLVFTYDEKGFLNLYDERGTRVWRSAADSGGFLNVFKKESPASYVEAGTWSVKDRLFSRQKEVVAVNRTPLTEYAKGIGYKSSRLRSYWWNGFSVEEGTLVDDIKGTLLDYTVSGDTIAVLASPFLGIKFDKILKGENPLGAALYLYSVKGR